MEDKLNKPLKILFLPAWYPEKDKTVGGIFIREHARAVSLYNKVVVLYIEKATPDTGPGPTEFRSEVVEDGIRTIRIYYRESSIPGFIYPRQIISVYRGLARLIREGWTPDIIHAHIYSAGFTAILMKMIFRIPVVLSEHSSDFMRATPRRPNMLKARLALQKANIVLPVSRHLMESIKHYRLGRSFRVVPNAVNTELFHPPEDGVEPGKKKILFIGLLKPLKGISYLLDAIGILAGKRHDFVLDIVGDGPARKELERMTGRLGLDKFVRFRGLKTKEEVARIMRGSSFLVQPSLVETFGVTIIEAMACGKPVVATDLPVFREKINTGRGILVPAGDDVALAGAIDTMLDRYQYYIPGEMAEYARRNYSYEILGNKLNEVYQDVLRTI
ncbi:MAG TPA: glycosyltransferase family 4 protein [Proteobacteria bacterium]|nr:glycosyltransferase family 4 protein [Pseudomonadota bacterium]